MFGDRQAYMDKFKTCARARPFDDQKLDSKFYEKEHTKPLFIKHSVLNVHNLYLYHCANDIFKILKFRNPISLYSLFDLSTRNGKETFLITPTPSDSYIYRASIIWNFVRQERLLDDFTTEHSNFKSSIKKYIINIQKEGDCHEWNASLNNLNHAGNVYN